MAASDEIRKLKETTAAAKAEMDKLLKGADALERKAIKTTDAYKDQVTILRETNEQIKDKLGNEKSVIDSIIQQEGKLKGLTGLQASLVELDPVPAMTGILPLLSLIWAARNLNGSSKYSA